MSAVKAYKSCISLLYPSHPTWKNSHIRRNWDEAYNMQRDQHFLEYLATKHKTGGGKIGSGESTSGTGERTEQQNAYVLLSQNTACIQNSEYAEYAETI